MALHGSPWAFFGQTPPGICRVDRKLIFLLFRDVNFHYDPKTSCQCFWELDYCKNQNNFAQINFGQDPSGPKLTLGKPYFAQINFGQNPFGPNAHESAVIFHPVP
jgi:hypothetical protein